MGGPVAEEEEGARLGAGSPDTGPADLGRICALYNTNGRRG